MLKISKPDETIIIYRQNHAELELSFVCTDSKERQEIGFNNAKLIKETFNVANETGLTPRELLEQRNELLDIIKKAMSNVHSPDGYLPCIGAPLTYRMKTAIANAEKPNDQD